MEEAFLAILLASSGVTALVVDRIEWGRHPQGQPLPGLVLNKIDGAGGHTLDGPDGLLFGRVQVDGYALTYPEAKALERAVLAALDGYSGNGYQGVFHVGSSDGREGGTNEAEIIRVSMDFLVTFNTTT